MSANATNDKPGRPTDYSQELAERICARIMDGESLRKICKDSDMPNRSTVNRWLASADHVEFCTQYTHAREVQADFYADEIIDLADDSSRDAIQHSGAIERSKIQIDARKWVASKLKPKKYGSFKSIELNGQLENKQADLSHLTFEQLYELKHGRKPE